MSSEERVAANMRTWSTETLIETLGAWADDMEQPYVQVLMKEAVRRLTEVQATLMPLIEVVLQTYVDAVSAAADEDVFSRINAYIQDHPEVVEKLR